MNHTPGPWSLHPYGDGSETFVPNYPDREGWSSWRFAVGSGRTLLAEVSAHTNPAGYPRPENRAEAEANANLIAAAPELLGTLENLLNFVKLRQSESSPVDGVVYSSISEAKAAIRKAKGGKP